MKLTAEMEARIKEVYYDAPVDGSDSKKWTEEGKEAYQDGIYTVLDILGIKVGDINA